MNRYGYFNYLKFFLKYFLFFACFAFSSELFAGVFDVLPTDKSKQYLGIIFGGNIGAVVLGGGTNPMLSKMFQYFNVLVLGFGVIILAWVGLVALINTAREGEAMGRKFSLWVPLRGLFGMLLLIPSPGSGYSLIQMTVMWIVLNGIGAANAVWTIVLNQLALGVPSVGNIPINITNGQLDGLARNILMSETCMVSFNQFQGSSLYQNYGPVRVIVQAQPILYSPSQSAPTTLAQTAIISVGVPNSGNPSVPDPVLGALCGSYTVSTSICNPSAMTSAGGSNSTVCLDTFNAASITQRLNFKVGALLAMFNVLGPAAQTVATSNVPPPNGYFSAAYDAYRSGIANLAGGVNMQIGQPPTIGSPGFTPQNLGLTNTSAQAGSWWKGQVNQTESGLKSTGPALANYGTLAQGGYSTTAQAIGMGGGGAMGTGPATTSAEAAGIGTAQAVGLGAKEAGLYLAYPAVQGGGLAVQMAAPTVANALNWAYPTWEQQSQVVPVTQTQVNNLLQVGWIHAGSYYYSLSQSSAQSPLGNELQNIPSPASTIPTQTGNLVANVAPQEWSSAVYNQLANDANRSVYNAALTNANQFYLADHNFTPATSLPSLGSGQASTGNQFLDQIVNALSSSYRQPIMDFIQNELMGTGAVVQGSIDPLITIGRFGWTMMMAGEISVFVVIALTFTLLLALAAGSCMSPLAWAINGLLMQIFGVVLGVVTLLWTAGATLGVYTPLVPYIIFTTTAFGWFLVVAEALVGAPIVALALVQPGGEELGNIKEGLGMIVNVFMRPTLMIFGFILASGILRGGLTLINFGFMTAVNNSVLPTIFSIIPTIGVYTFLVVAVVNQAFGLIYELPNRIMNYMGMRHEGFGSQVGKELTGEAKQGFQAGAQIGQKGVGAMSEQAQKGYGQVASKLGHMKRTSLPI